MDLQRWPCSTAPWWASRRAPPISAGCTGRSWCGTVSGPRSRPRRASSDHGVECSRRCAIPPAPRTFPTRRSSRWPSMRVWPGRASVAGSSPPALDELTARGVRTAKVVAGAENVAAVAVYTALRLRSDRPHRAACRHHVGSAGVEFLLALLVALVVTPMAAAAGAPRRHRRRAGTAEVAHATRCPTSAVWPSWPASRWGSEPSGDGSCSCRSALRSSSGPSTTRIR